MNDDSRDAQTEDELRVLRPVAVSRQLEAQIADLLTDPALPARRPPWWYGLGFARRGAALGWGLLCPAATVVVTLIVTHLGGWGSLPFPSSSDATVADSLASRTTQTSSVKGTPGVRAANVLYGAIDEGVVPADGNEPVHRVRYRSTDHVQWQNPRTGAQWEISYPREDVLLIPVQVE